MGPPQVPMQAAGGGSPPPPLTEMFLAALPWLHFLQGQQGAPGQPPQLHPHALPQQQHGPPHAHQSQQQLPPLHLHQQQQQQQPLAPPQFGAMPQRPSSQPQQQQAGFGFLPPPHQQQAGHSFSAGHFGTLPPSEASGSSQMEGIIPGPPPIARSASASNTPSPEAGTPLEPTEAEATAIAEDKRRRNTAASARFRIKKKQWTLNLERTISDLSGRVEELEREASELRRENGWLKEIVMLKSKRLSGVVPELEPAPSSSSGGGGGGASGSGSGSGGPAGQEKPPEQEGSRETSEEADQQRTGGGGRHDKGKGRQRPP
ncbi:hypothetical protein BD309DRAFT_969453 [Dichomitus squalens]|nr:hypothetical protein BD309DRAFT_969453 [Dichomitus squalens]